MKVFIDIETASIVQDWPALDERRYAEWKRKFINPLVNKAEEAGPSEQWKQKAALMPEFGRVVAVAAATIELVSPTKWDNVIIKEPYRGGADGVIPHIEVICFASDDEAAVLRVFQTAISKATKLVGHNLKEFDAPYLFARLHANGMGIPGILNMAGKKPWEVPWEDTMEIWRNGTGRRNVSLELMCATLGIPGKGGKIDSAEVSHLFWTSAANLPLIAEHCGHDVLACARAYLKLTGITTTPTWDILDPKGMIVATSEKTQEES